MKRSVQTNLKEETILKGLILRPAIFDPDTDSMKTIMNVDRS